MEVRLTKSLLAEHKVAGLAGFALSGLVDGLDPETVLLLLHQTFKQVLCHRNVLCDTDPLLTSCLLELNDVAIDLGTAVMLRPGPQQVGRGLADIFHEWLAWSPWSVWIQHNVNMGVSHSFQQVINLK